MDRILGTISLRIAWRVLGKITAFATQKVAWPMITMMFLKYSCYTDMVNERESS